MSNPGSSQAFENETISLPWNISKSSMFNAVASSLSLIGHELGARYDSIIIPELGADWLSKLSIERGSRITLQDPGFVFKEPLHFPASPTRQALPKTPGFFFLLRDCLKIRNRYYHQDFAGTVEETASSVQTLFSLTIEIPLVHSSSEIARLAMRLRELSDGNTFPPESDISQLQVQSQEEYATLEEELAAERDRLRELETGLEDLRTQRAVEHERLKALENDGESARAALEQARVEMAKMQLDLVRREDELSIERATAEKRKLIEVEAAKILRHFIQAEKERIGTKTLVPEVLHGITPGELWPYEKGTRRLTLFVTSRELIETDSKIPLSEEYGDAAVKMAHAWLEIKPNGGRVFIDSDGDACCFRGEDLIYLGNLNDMI